MFLFTPLVSPSAFGKELERQQVVRTRDPQSDVLVLIRGERLIELVDKQAAAAGVLGQEENSLIRVLSGDARRPDLNTWRRLPEGGVELGAHRPGSRLLLRMRRIGSAHVHDQRLLPGLALTELLIQPRQRNERVLFARLSFDRHEIGLVADVDGMTHEQNEDAILGPAGGKEVADGALDDRLRRGTGGGS